MQKEAKKKQSVLTFTEDRQYPPNVFFFVVQKLDITVHKLDIPLHQPIKLIGYNTAS